MRTFDFAPFYRSTVGFDRVFSTLDQLVGVDGSVPSYPPHKWTAALAVAALFALQPTVSNAQSRIGSANSVKPEASGSIAGTLSAGSGVHANETIKTGSAGQAGLGFVDNTISMLGLRQMCVLTSLSMTQTRAQAA